MKQIILSLSVLAVTWATSHAQPPQEVARQSKVELPASARFSAQQVAWPLQLCGVQVGILQAAQPKAQKADVRLLTIYNNYSHTDSTWHFLGKSILLPTTGVSNLDLRRNLAKEEPVRVVEATPDTSFCPLDRYYVKRAQGVQYIAPQLIEAFVEGRYEDIEPHLLPQVPLEVEIRHQTSQTVETLEIITEMGLMNFFLTEPDEEPKRVKANLLGVTSREALFWEGAHAHNVLYMQKIEFMWTGERYPKLKKIILVDGQ